MVTKEEVLTDEQLEWLRTHPVMTKAQLQQLASQLSALRRINLQLREIRRSARLRASLLMGWPSAKPLASAKPKMQKARAKRLRPEEDIEPEAETGSDSAGADEPASTPRRRPARKGRPSCLRESDVEAEADEEELQVRRRVAFLPLDRKPIKLPQLQPVHLAPAQCENSDYDAPCDVCGDPDQNEENQIVLCDGPNCSVAVHQTCYGIARIPRGQWLCDGCRDGLQASDANCCCCPAVGGALREVESFGNVQPAGVEQLGQRHYLHLACALWTPDIMLASPEAMKGIKLDHLSRERLQLVCQLCKQGGGAVIQCAFRSCCRPFHVLCGRAAGNLLPLTVDGEPLGFCAEHSKEKYTRSRDKVLEGRPGSGSLSTSETPTTTECVPEVPNEYELQRQRNIERNRRMLQALAAGAAAC